MDYYAIGLLVGIAGIIVSLVSVAYWLGAKLARLEDRLDKLESDVKALKGDVRDGFNRLANAIVNVGVTIIEYLETRGILGTKNANYLKETIKRLAVTNPFTETERKRLIELIDKDDLTPEEADELERLARKFYNEYWDKVPDAWKMLLYAASKRRITYRKYGREVTPPD
jgi:hypothetical protein